MAPSAPRIEICGVIAAGKTTLARSLAGVGLRPVLERFDRNPFLEAFYEDPAGNAFETEVTFLLQHYHQIRRAMREEGGFTCDFSPLLDRAYADVTLSGSQHATFVEVLAEVDRSIGTPALLVHVKCAPEVAYSRIRQRARECEAGITLEYLQALGEAIRARLEVASTTTRVVSVDAARHDYANDEKTRNEVVASVSRAADLLDR